MDSLYRTLVPSAPRFLRTEGDPPKPELFAAREIITNLSLTLEKKAPGLKDPSLISTYAGKITSLLFAFPQFAIAQPAYVAAYKSVLTAMEVGTKFTVVHPKSHKAEVESWFDQSGHGGNTTYVSLPDYVAFTDWAEDAYVSLSDLSDGAHYLMEPWEFKRAGDALIADAVEEAGVLTASQAPLIFQGGNCLIANDHWFIGRDYFVDSTALLVSARAPVDVPEQDTPANFVTKLFHDYIDAKRELVVLGSEKPLAITPYVGTKDAGAYYLDIVAAGAGTYQPIFHIDMFVTLVGNVNGNSFKTLVGDPRLADNLLGVTSPYSAPEAYDLIARQLEKIGFEVVRNPLVHWPSVGQSLKLSELKKEAQKPGGSVLISSIAELHALGANDNTNIAVRSWHHITWNNCLVENAGDFARVYLPTFGYEEMASLAVIDSHMKQIWEALGFEVRMLGNFNEFARRMGVVHCIKKYLGRDPAKIANPSA